MNKVITRFGSPQIDILSVADQVFPEEDEEFWATLRAVCYVRDKLDVDDAAPPAGEPDRERNADPLYYLV